MTRRRRIIYYAVFGVFSFLLFTMVLFPFDALKTRMAQEIEGRLGDDYHVQIESLRPTLMAGVVFKGLELRNLSGGHTLLVVQKGSLNLRLLPLLWGKTSLKFSLESKVGNLSGRVTATRAKTQIEWNLKNADLGRLPLLSEKFGLNVKSLISGESALEIYKNHPELNKGSVKFSISELKTGQSDVKLGQGEAALSYPLPPLTFADKEHPALFDLELEKGRFQINAITFQGGDLNLNLTGKLFMTGRLENSRLSLRGDVGLSEGLSTAIPIMALFDKEKKEDGKYPLTVSGRLFQPSIRIGAMALPF